MTGDRIFIIAEAGVNHNGSLDMAFDLVDTAAEADADAIKFQTFKAERLASRDAPKAAYQTRTTGADESQFDMLKRLELDAAAHERLIARCKDRGIQFLSTPFDPESLDLLVNRLDLPIIKLGSGELTNGPLLLAAARSGRPIILSTGMGTLEEVGDALAVLAFGYTAAAQAAPERAAFEASLAAPAARAMLAEKVTLLHCTTEYPAPFEDVNLRAMATLRDAFGLAVGYSDHTRGIAVTVAAAALGACTIEKHFTLDRTLPGPDHAASLEPGELTAMVQAIREVEAALGDGRKEPAPSERGNIAVARKSVVAAGPIAAGERLTLENLTVKRPGGGLSPMRLWEILDSTAGRDYAADEPLDP